MKPPTLKAEVCMTLPSYGTYMKLQSAFSIYDIHYLIALCVTEVSFFSTLHTHSTSTAAHSITVFC